MDISGYDRGDATHKMIEAMKLAFVDGMHYVTDPRYMGVTPAELLSKEYAAKRRELISDTALLPEHGDPTVAALSTCAPPTARGNMVSFIQEQLPGLRLWRGCARHRHRPQRPGQQLHPG